jgi:sec1 family domain-containing protein 1
LADDVRQPVPDVPAVYFVEANAEMIDRIANDCARRLYDSFYFNFVTTIPKPLLDDLALKALESDSVKRVMQVYDQYLGFIALEPQLFSMGIPNSYAKLHARDEATVIGCVEKIVDSMFCVLATLGEVPIVRAQRGGAAEMVGTKLVNKIREQLRQRKNVFSSKKQGRSFGRRLLVLVDRDLDLQCALHHPWTYQAMVHDLVDYHSNRVTVSAHYCCRSLYRCLDLNSISCLRPKMAIPKRRSISTEAIHFGLQMQLNRSKPLQSKCRPS